MQEVQYYVYFYNINTHIWANHARLSFSQMHQCQFILNQFLMAQMMYSISDNLND